MSADTTSVHALLISNLEEFDEKKYGENTAKKAQELLEELLVP